MNQKQKLPIPNLWQKLKGLGLIWLLCCFGASINAQNQSETATTSTQAVQSIAENKTSIDRESYKANKEQWEAKMIESQMPTAQITIMLAAFNKLSPREQAVIKANPNLYRIVDLGNTTPGKGQVSRKALETMAPEKAENILANPDKFEIKD